MERVAQRKSCAKIIIKLEKLKDKAGHYQALGPAMASIVWNIGYRALL